MCVCVCVCFVSAQVEPVLSTRACHKCNTQIFEGSLLCSSCNVRFKPCVVTGMPVGRGRGELAAEEVFVNFHRCVPPKVT